MQVKTNRNSKNINFLSMNNLIISVDGAAVLFQKNFPFLKCLVQCVCGRHIDCTYVPKRVKNKKNLNYFLILQIFLLWFSKKYLLQKKEEGEGLVKRPNWAFSKMKGIITTDVKLFIRGEEQDEEREREQETFLYLVLVLLRVIADIFTVHTKAKWPKFV